MDQSRHFGRRLVALGASVLIGLASGTPYLYGVYSPQLLQRCGLAASDSATLSLAVNLGTAVGGLVGGVAIDHIGPSRAILAGSVTIFAGYMGLYSAYVKSVASVLLLCVAISLVGFGSITSYFSTLKTTQANFPNHRGSAGAFPVSSYGLSATIFSAVAATFFSNDTGGFLYFVAVASGGVVFLSSFFVDIHLDHDDHDDHDPESGPQAPNTASIGSIQSTEEAVYFESSTANRGDSSASLSDQVSLAGSLAFWGIGERTPRESTASETTPLVQDLSHKSSAASLRQSPSQLALSQQAAKKVPAAKSKSKHSKKNPTQMIQYLLTNRLFLIHTLFVALVAGIGQMYIYSVGFIVSAQFHYEASVADDSAALGQLQALQVSVISIASFSGRLLSGFVSDLIHKKLHIQRLWVVFVAVLLMALNQYICMKNVHNTHLVILTSTLTGGCFGLTFGVYPAIIADEFGTKNFSTSWGLICAPPFIVLYLLNKYFGFIYDANTDSKTRICYKGNGCYKEAFELTFGLCFMLMIVTLFLIYLHRNKHQ